MKNLGFRIKQLREEREISQEELAHQLNISQSKLSKIENGKLKVSLILLINIFRFFTLTLEDLIEVLGNL